MLSRMRHLAIQVAAAAMILGATAAARAAEDEATWTSIKPDIFGERAIAADAGVISLDAPDRAEDAALVPIDIHIAIPEADHRAVVVVTLVVDENPSPVVATFTLGEATRHFDLSTRVRVNAYSYVRAVAQTSDGTLYMARAFVKASGGCSSPAVKDPAEAKANLGKMRFRVFAGTGRDEAQVQIRHPNYSGLQMDQVTRLYTPAWFVQTLSVTQGETILFTMEGGISISEDPTFRFSYRADGRPVTVEAKDTEGHVFRQGFTGDGGT
ncbi:quinoprotein dehydrogenase-associated SoxYZ-like carrier [Oleomonas cavernae]|uniref:Quinoprotein dehydrogenase-associated SoxYZ-like carrier n=1 Tax=Oleomonas cavernae TaxID=2320859 RepID=A0A418VTV0_9PROT|nr:quinoprotein dehydrogenase-associated SoxYZ-like carrier [Oleomonas cavernae]RJF80572.1 quinoprotein dehydrogenase-associated SoxYZ-like carrier [Oleomonas cavernae]